MRAVAVERDFDVGDEMLIGRDRKILAHLDEPGADLVPSAADGAVLAPVDVGILGKAAVPKRPVSGIDGACLAMQQILNANTIAHLVKIAHVFGA